MANNNIHRVIIGETGQVLQSTLFDDNGAIPLTGYTVTIRVSTKANKTIINNESCVVLDQVANQGKITFTYDALVATYPNLVAGDHRIRFKLVNPSGKISYVPKLKKDTFGVFRAIA